VTIVHPAFGMLLIETNLWILFFWLWRKNVFVFY